MGDARKKGPVLDLAGLLAALRTPGPKYKIRCAAATHIEYLQSLLRDSTPSPVASFSHHNREADLMNEEARLKLVIADHGDVVSAGEERR